MNKDELDKFIQDTIREVTYEKINGNQYELPKTETEKKKISVEELDNVLFGEKRTSRIRLHEGEIPKINLSDIQKFEQEIAGILPDLAIKLEKFPSGAKEYSLQFFNDQKGNLNIKAVGAVTNLSSPLNFYMTLDYLKFSPSTRTDDNAKAIDQITDYYDQTWKKEWAKNISSSTMDDVDVGAETSSEPVLPPTTEPTPPI